MGDYHLQRIALAITVVFPILSTILVALRLYTRKFLTKRLGADDALIVAAWVLAIPEIYLSWMDIKLNHIGIHVWDIKSENTVLAEKYNYANQLAYNPILSLVKMSVILFLLRVNGQQKCIRIFAWSIFGVTFILMILILFIDAFQYWPIAYVWDTSIKGGKCIDRGVFYISTAALTIFTDLLVITLPTWITYRLQMKLRQKIIIIGLLSLGLIVTAVGVYRMVVLVQAYYTTGVDSDPTYNIGFCTSAVESNLAIMTACVPAIKQFVIRYLPTLLGMSYASRFPSGRTYYGPSKSGYGTGTQVSVRGGKSMAFEMGNMRNKQTPETASADNDSEKGIMTYNGIMRSIDVSVSYVGGMEDREATRSLDTIHESQPVDGRGDRGLNRGRRMSGESIV